MISAAMQIRPVRTEDDHDAALARIQELMPVLPGTPESDEFEILLALIDAYETKHFPIDAPDPVSMILFRMDQQGLTRKDLEPMIGSRARVSEVLGRKRNLTLSMIRRLSAGLQIPADFLIAPAQERIKRAKPKAVLSQAVSRKSLLPTAGKAPAKQSRRGK